PELFGIVEKKAFGQNSAVSVNRDIPEGWFRRRPDKSAPEKTCADAQELGRAERAEQTFQVEREVNEFSTIQNHTRGIYRKKIIPQKLLYKSCGIRILVVKSVGAGVVKASVERERA